MSKQYGREYRLVITQADGKEYTYKELRVVFSVVQSVLGTPNVATITLYNANAITIGSTVALYVAYADQNPQLLISSTIRNISIERKRADLLTILHTAEAENAWLKSSINKVWQSGTSNRQVVDDVVETLGLPINSIDPEAILPTKLLRGLSLAGSTKTTLDNLAITNGFDWSVQAGEVIIAQKDTAPPLASLSTISPDTGMIGSPTITRRGVDVTVLINPNLRPNGLFEVVAGTANIDVGNLNFQRVPKRNTSGRFKILQVESEGDTHGNLWQSTLTGLEEK